MLGSCNVRKSYWRALDEGCLPLTSAIHSDRAHALRGDFVQLCFHGRLISWMRRTLSAILGWECDCKIGGDKKVGAKALERGNAPPEYVQCSVNNIFVASNSADLSLGRQSQVCLMDPVQYMAILRNTYQYSSIFDDSMAWYFITQLEKNCF